MTRALCIALLCSPWLPAGGEERTLTAPRMGYIFEAHAGTLRSLDGIPGASLLGPALDTGLAIAGAAVSPDQSYILVITADGGLASVLAAGGSSWTRREIAGASLPVDTLVLSPSGKAAALYTAQAGVLQVVRGLPDAPVAGGELHVPNAGHIAVSDDGRLVLVSVRDESSPVLLFTDEDTGRAMAVSGPVSAVAFRPESHDALIATAGGVTLVRDAEAGAEYRLVSERPSGVALGFSRHGDRFFAAFDDSTIVSHDLMGRELSAIDCHCVPAMLQPMSFDSVFRLTEGDREPLLLLDGVRNRVVFVGRGER